MCAGPSSTGASRRQHRTTLVRALCHLAQAAAHWSEKSASPCAESRHDAVIAGHTASCLACVLEVRLADLRLCMVLAAHGQLCLMISTVRLLDQQHAALYGTKYIMLAFSDWCFLRCSAFFPLTDEALASWPVPYFLGEPRHATIAPDSLFGNALSCNRNAQVHRSSCPVNMVALTAERGGSSDSFTS